MTAPAAPLSIPTALVRGAINPYDRGGMPRAGAGRGNVEAPAAPGAKEMPAAAHATPESAVSAGPEGVTEDAAASAAPFIYRPDGRVAAAPRGPLGRLVDVRG